MFKLIFLDFLNGLFHVRIVAQGGRKEKGTGERRKVPPVGLIEYVYPQCVPPNERSKL